MTSRDPDPSDGFSAAMPTYRKAVERQPPAGWSFTIMEVSNGAYCVRGVGPDAVTIERCGANEIVLLNRLIDDAWKLTE